MSAMKAIAMMVSTWMTGLHEAHATTTLSPPCVGGSFGMNLFIRCLLAQTMVAFDGLDELYNP